MKKLKYFLGAAALAGSAFLANPVNAANPDTALVKVTIDETLGITLSSDNLNFELGDDLLKTQDLTVSGTTNNAAGYTISFNANNDYTELKHENTLVEANIPTLSETTTSAAFPTTAWGYSLDSENFNPVKTTSENIFTTSTKGANNHVFTTGIRASANITAGNYSNDLLFTIVANPNNGGNDPSNPGGGNGGSTLYMQDVATWGPSLELEQQVQAVDKRDGKIYWVAKLKDGNVWMTQNLDFDITEDNVTAALSDITEDWNMSSTYVPRTTLTNLGILNHFDASLDGYMETYSYDPGDYYWNGIWQDYSEGIVGYNNSFSQVLSTTATEEQEKHYHIGNYYQWNAATAGTGGDVVLGAEAPGSICPKGWRLPISDEIDANYSFGKIVTEYNVRSGTDASTSPLFYTPSGQSGRGKMAGIGTAGDYWSSNASGNHYDSAYYFYTNQTGYNEYTSYNRYYGFSVRCVAR
ncbi:MAG: hypothetical protein MJZ22_03075 [Candidatus Saccharibacteria bacterium]|nr:hypothetical protein [Candidatus Saccharibacteria bacterium]